MTRPVRTREREPVQRRTLGTLVVSQVCGGLGLSGSIAVGSILAEDILGSSELAGLANTTQILGSAILAVPAARIMASLGRRAGLTVGYLVAASGAMLAITAALLRSFPLLLVGAFLIGAATTANNQARFAAVDLSTPDHRGRDLSLIVWATTVGAVIGPNLIGPSEPIGRALHVNPVVGVLAVSITFFVLASVWLMVRLRPDPLLLARRRREATGLSRPAHGSALRAATVVRAYPSALVGLTTMALGHVVMVSVMVMTPLHITHGGGSLRLVGFIISVHVLGMYAFSPLMGRLVDRRGARATALVGGGILLAACVLSALTPGGDSPGLAVGLFLLGLGWSGTLVSGSTLVTSSVPDEERPGVQGLADLSMGLCGALGGGLSGFVIQWWGYPALAVIGGLVAVVLLAIIARGPRRTVAQ